MTRVAEQYADFRVFIFGVEVTQDVTGLTFTRTNQRAPSTAVITLANRQDGDRYIVTEQDILTLYKPTDQPLDLKLPEFQAYLQSAFEENAGSFGGVAAQQRVLARAQALQSANVRNRTAFALDTLKAEGLRRVASVITDPIKARVYAAKAYETLEVSAPAIGSTALVSSLSDLEKITGVARRFPFQVGDSIFHSNDAVRIFVRDPDDPNTWRYGFTGFVSNASETFSSGGGNTVQLTCECPLRAFRYARVAFNPGIFDIAALAQQEDAVVRTFFQEGLTALNFPEFIYTVVFGAEAAGSIQKLRTVAGQTVASTIRGINAVPFLRYGANADPAVSTAEQTGVGSFNLSGSTIWVYGPDSSPATSANATDINTALSAREVRIGGPFALQAYQNYVDSIVRLSDPQTMRLPGTGDGPTLTTADQVISEIGQYPQYYPVDYGRLTMLLPGSIGPNVPRSVLLSDIIQSVATQTTYRTRLQMIYDICDRLEFSFYASPRGDLICEMPLYDFDPDDFGDTDRRPAGPQTVFGAAVEAGRSESTDVSNTFGQGVRVQPFHQGIALAVSQGADQMSRAYAQDFFATRQDIREYSRTFNDETVRTQMAVPWYPIKGYEGGGNSDLIGQAPSVITRRSLVPQYGVRLEMGEPHAFVASKEAASVYAELKLNQWNANAREVSLSMTPKMSWMPNRPIKIQYRAAIASVHTVQFTLTVPNAYDMTPTLHYLRGWDGSLGEDGQPIYLPLGGALSTAFNYPMLLGSARYSSPSATGGRPLDPSIADPPTDPNRGIA